MKQLSDFEMFYGCVVGKPLGVFMKKKKINKQDLTLRNLRAINKRLVALENKVKVLIRCEARRIRIRNGWKKGVKK